MPLNTLNLCGMNILVAGDLHRRVDEGHATCPSVCGARKVHDMSLFA